MFDLIPEGPPSILFPVIPTHVRSHSRRSSIHIIPCHSHITHPSLLSHTHSRITSKIPSSHSQVPSSSNIIRHSTVNIPSHISSSNAASNGISQIAQPRNAGNGRQGCGHGVWSHSRRSSTHSHPGIASSHAHIASSIRQVPGHISEGTSPRTKPHPNALQSLWQSIGLKSLSVLPRTVLRELVVPDLHGVVEQLLVVEHRNGLDRLHRVVKSDEGKPPGFPLFIPDEFTAHDPAGHAEHLPQLLLVNTRSQIGNKNPVVERPINPQTVQELRRQPISAAIVPSPASPTSTSHFPS